MALINCPECGNKISSQAKACGECGYPIRRAIVIDNLSAFIRRYWLIISARPRAEYNGKSHPVCKSILAIFCPPLAVLFMAGIRPVFWLNVVLTILGFIPGVIHALDLTLFGKRDFGKEDFDFRSAFLAILMGSSMASLVVTPFLENILRYVSSSTLGMVIAVHYFAFAVFGTFVWIISRFFKSNKQTVFSLLFFVPLVFVVFALVTVIGEGNNHENIYESCWYDNNHSAMREFDFKSPQKAFQLEEANVPETPKEFDFSIKVKRNEVTAPIKKHRREVDMTVASYGHYNTAKAILEDKADDTTEAAAARKRIRETYSAEQVSEVLRSEADTFEMGLRLSRSADAALEMAIGKVPDHETKVRMYSRRLGVTSDFVSENFDLVEQKLLYADQKGAFKNTTRLKEWASEPGNMGIGKDTLAHLSRIEGMLVAKHGEPINQAIYIIKREAEMLREYVGITE